RKDRQFFQRVVDDVDLRALMYEMNVAAATIARRAADRAAKQTGSSRFVAGSIGPLPVTASISPDVNDPSFRAVTFDQLRQAYFDQVRALVEGGVDLLIVETIFDTLNAKAALFAIAEVFQQTGKKLPLMISGTVTDRSDIGGGCGGTPAEHMRVLGDAVRGPKPRSVPPRGSLSVPSNESRTRQRAPLQLSGFEPLNVTPEMGFVVIGERTNITGSPKFSKLILGNDFDGALAVARQQVQGGANILDVNMDEGMIDSEAAMTRFLNLIGSEPEIARIPLMIDSSKWSVIEAGLKCVQGKAVVNSISLKNGEEEFLRQARLIRRYGAAVIVMAFDEQGQADNLQRKIEICACAYKLLTERADFSATDIIFDPNILTVATGLEEHRNYAVDFIDATRWIKKDLPGVRVSGGVSNISFSFRGNNTVREAMHAAFLFHAIRAGLDMAIVNAGQLAVYQEIDPELRK